MNNDPTPNPGEQAPCTGQNGGHAPAEGKRQRFRAGISDVDDRIYVVALQAIQGERCTGTFRAAIPDRDIDITFHAVRLVILAEPPFSEAPRAHVVIDRRPDGPVNDYALGFDGLLAEQARRILEGWRIAFPFRVGEEQAEPQRYALTPSPGGRPKGSKAGGLSSEQVRDITNTIRAMKESRRPEKEIIAFLNRAYPEEDYGHKWNRMTIWRWLNEPNDARGNM